MKSISIENFKCFTGLNQIPVAPLTVLVGSNNAGKSSVIQSLQLLHKAAGADEGVPIWLNDETSDTWFGTFGDVINIQSPEDKFSIGFNDEDTGAALLMDFGHNGDVETAANVCGVTKGENGLVPSEMNGMEFYFLSCERYGPRLSSGLGNMDYPSVGCHGENCAQILCDSDSRIKVESARAFGKEKNLNLLPQVNAWLNYIFPGIVVKKPKNYNNLSPSIMVEDRHGEEFLPTNMGFGISYSLPIVISCLIARTGKIVAVQNPEAHLHPDAQTRIGEFLAHASGFGFSLIVETHSDHVLEGMQIYYANHPELKGDAIVNCFGISENGSTVVEPIGFREDLQFDKMPKGFMDRTIRNYGLLRKSLAAIERGERNSECI